MAEIPERYLPQYDCASGWTCPKLTEQLIEELGTAEACIRELEQALEEMRQQHTPRCGASILADSFGKVYGCSRLKDHDGPHETIEDRRSSQAARGSNDAQYL